MCVAPGVEPCLSFDTALRNVVSFNPSLHPPIFAMLKQ
nr:MAG TPA: hypothetical protein [Caudoviricetes sp.]